MVQAGPGAQQVAIWAAGAAVAVLACETYVRQSNTLWLEVTQ